MFDSDNRANILTGSLIQVSAQARANASEADRANRAARDWRLHAEGLEARIAELELALLVKTAHAEGLTARVKGFIAAHPDSPERRDTGKRYKDGDTKTVGIARYEAAFDAFLKDKGIATPTKHRAD